MKKNKFIFRAMLVLSVSAFVLGGCKKKEQEDNDTSGASDNAFAESSVNDMGTIMDQGSTGTVSGYMNSNNDNGSLLSACAVVTIDSLNNSNPDTLTVNFGTSNCLCLDGRYRRGSLQCIYTGGKHYRDSGLTVTITPINYYVNDNGIAGSKTIINKGHVTNGKLTWQITSNITVTLANSAGTFTWNCSKTKVLEAGETTFGGPINWAIAKWTITGSVNGTTVGGESYTAQTTSPLWRDMTCGVPNKRHFTQGTVDFTPGSKPTRHIDFGNGACDNIATVTINNHTYTIYLK